MTDAPLQPDTGLQRAEPVALATVAAAPVTIMDMVRQLASNPNVDVEKYRAILGMAREMEKDQAAKDFAIAMTATQAEIPRVRKSAHNTQTNSDYAPLEDVQNAVKPVAARHGLTFDCTELESKDSVTVRLQGTVSHVKGHSRTFYREGRIDDVGIKGNANKTALHARQSSVTYLKTHMLADIFGVTLSKKDSIDDDGNTAGGGFITEEQRIQLQEMAQAYGVNKERLFKALMIESLDQLPAPSFPIAFSWLKSRDPKAPKGAAQ